MKILEEYGMWYVIVKNGDYAAYRGKGDTKKDALENFIETFIEE